MSTFIKNPNLPEENVVRIIAGVIPVSVRNELENRNVELLEIRSNPFLKRLSGHADLQVIHLADNRMLVCDSQKGLADKLSEYGFNVDAFSLKGGEYPYDCAVNAAIIGKRVICKYDVLEEKLKHFIDENGYEIINVNQGYSKCSVCIVNDNSVITEDESIKNACEKHGISVLLIKKGFVKLDGFDYGFIGGASFKLNKDTLAFVGKIENHPDFMRIKDFLSKKGINYISLGDSELTDIGSVIPINC